MSISIIIPTVNRLPLLQRAVKSALSQTLPTEVLVSDNGSTDGTAAYLGSLEHPLLEKRRIHKTVSAPKHTEYLHRWLQTDWVVFLSDDDYLEKSFIENIQKHIERHPSCVLVYSQAVIHMWDVEYAGKAGPPEEPGWRFMLEFLKGNREPCWCAMALRRSDLLEIGAQPADRHIGDMYYWGRIAPKGSVGCVSRPLSHYTYVSDQIQNITGGITLESWRLESQILVNEFRERIAQQAGPLGPPSSAMGRINHRFLAKTCANQIIWNKMRGKSLFSIWSEMSGCMVFFFHAPGVWLRVLGAAFGTRSFVKWCIRIHVNSKPARRSHSQGFSACQ